MPCKVQRAHSMYNMQCALSVCNVQCVQSMYKVQCTMCNLHNQYVMYNVCNQCAMCNVQCAMGKIGVQCAMCTGLQLKVVYHATTLSDLQSQTFALYCYFNVLKKVFPFYDGNLMKMIIRIPLPCQPSKTRWLVGEPGRERCLPACNSPTLVSSLLCTSLLTHSPLPPTQTPHQPVDPLPPSADPDSRIARRQQAFCS